MIENTKTIASRWAVFRSVGGLVLFWNILLAFGGFVMLTFVVTNRFLPELDFSGIVFLLASVSLVSLFIIFAISVLTSGGGWALYNWFGNIDPEVRGRMSFLPATLSTCGLYIFLTCVWEAPKWVLAIAIVVLIILAVITIYYIIFTSKEHTLSKKLSLIGTALFVGLFFAILNATIFTRLYQEQPGVGNETKWILWITLATWLMVQAMCIGIVAASCTRAALFIRSLIITIVVFFLLLMLSNYSTFLQERMAQMLGIGAMPNINLVVTQEGCQTLNVLSNGALCTPVPDQPVYSVESITLRSRLGKQMLIEYTSNRYTTHPPEKVVHEIMLQASEVLSWQRQQHSQ